MESIYMVVIIYHVLETISHNMDQDSMVLKLVVMEITKQQEQ